MLAEYAKAGDSNSIFLFRQIGHYLGKGIALLTDVLNPEVIVIESIFARCENLLRESMEEELRKEAIHYSAENLSILPAELGEELGNYVSVMTAVIGTGCDYLLQAQDEPSAVTRQYERLFFRYPLLNPCREEIMEAYQMLKDTYLQHEKLLLIGNGGSCADCGHIAGELMKGFWLRRPLDTSLKEKLNFQLENIYPHCGDLLQQGLPAIDLNMNPALATAFANDADPLLPPVQQLQVLQWILFSASAQAEIRKTCCSL